MNITPPKVTNIVINFDTHCPYNFRKFISNRNFSYEAELFPAALISYWRPAHVTLFSNGRGMVTGIRSEVEARKIISEIDAVLERHRHASVSR